MPNSRSKSKVRIEAYVPKVYANKLSELARRTKRTKTEVLISLLAKANVFDLGATFRALESAPKQVKTSDEAGQY